MKKIVALVLSLVMVLGLATTAFAMPNTYDFYDADASLAADLAVGNVKTGYAGATFTEVNAKTNADGTGNVAYLSSNVYPYYFVKTDAPTVNDFAITAHGKSEVLFYVTAATAADVTFVATAKAFNNFGTSCGQLYQVDKEKVYFEIIVGATAGVLPGDVVVEVYPDAQGNYSCTPMNVLVGTEIKVVDSAELVAGSTLTPDKLLKHSWAITGVAYSASLGNVPTEAKCLNCGAVVDTFYLGAGKVPAGETGLKLASPYDKWYIVEPDFAAATPVAPSVDGEKVESAETFDAGIAMYVGMSVMAAAGSAVVLKKKD